jgi:hypothetical protein
MSDAVPRTEACHNCGALLHGPFCSACGQEARSLDPSISELAHDVAHELVDVDGRIFRSVRRLFLSPGFLTRELFLGRRVPWISPMRLYLIFSVAYFAVVALGGTNIRVSISGDTEHDKAIALQARGFASEQEMRATVIGALATWMPRMNFALVPLFAWLVSLVRRGSGRRYPQHLLFALHAHAAWFGVRAIAAAFTLVPPVVIGEALNNLSVFYGMVYLVIAFRVAYGVTTRRAIRDTAIVLGIYGICVAAAMLGVMLPVLFWRRA